MIAILTERTNKGYSVVYFNPDPVNPKSRYYTRKTERQLRDDEYIILPQYDKDNYPVPEDNGMSAAMYYNPDTNEIYYQYTPIPEREDALRIAALEEAVDTLSLELLLMTGGTR